MLPSAAAHLLAFPDSAGAALPVDRDDPVVRGLVSAARAGDQAAFGQLIERHESAVFRTALAALGRAEDAEDAAQEAFLVAWQKLPGFRGDATFRTWLLTITWHKALDRRRRRSQWWRRTQWTSDAIAAEHVRHPAEDLAAESATPERAAVARDLARHVAVEIAQLSPKLRDALLLATSGEYSYGEVAALLGIPLGTVKWRVSEARRMITSRLPAAGRHE